MRVREPKSCPMTYNQELAVLEKYKDSLDCVKENCEWWLETEKMCTVKCIGIEFLRKFQERAVIKDYEKGKEL